MPDQLFSKIILINLYINTYKLSNMCTASEISKRTYYKYRNAEDKDYYDYQKNKIKDSTLKTYKDRIKYMGLLDNVELVNLNWDLYQKFQRYKNLFFQILHNLQ